MRWSSFAVAAALSAAVGSSAFADEIFFKNGDHLAGKIESIEAGNAAFTSAAGFKTSVDLKDVKTFTTDGPVAIKLTDGTVIREKVSAGPEGQIAVTPAGAQQAENIPLTRIGAMNFEVDWSGSLTAGGSLSRGNTNTDAFNLSLDLVHRTANDRTTIGAGFLYGRQQVDIGPGATAKKETANDWFFAGKYDYFFTQKLYGYANVRVERDLIAGISLRITPGVGAGYQWVDQPDFHFNTEGGVSYLYRAYTHGGGHSEAVAARAAYHVDKKINDKVLLFHNFEYYPGLDRVDNYVFDGDVGIRATLTAKMFTEFKIQEQYDSNPAPGKGHNDTRFILGVGWNF